MSETSDDTLRRLFAQAPRVSEDEGFVAQVAVDVSRRRGALRTRRAVLVVALCAAGLGLALLLAPLAFTTSVSGVGDSLLGLPEQVGNAAWHIRNVPGAPYFGIALAAIVLPLAGVAWLSRRT